MSTASQIEKPVVGYVVITFALLAGILTATALGQTPTVSQTQNVETRLIPGHENSHPQRRWILGVRADATDAGYLVRSVEHRSAARKIGLEPGDRIVAINGEQIGLVGREIVALSQTLERCGSRNGRVHLLVQNRRNQRLVSLAATLLHPNDHMGH